MNPANIRLLDPREIEPVVGLWRRSREDAQPWLEARMGYSPAQDLSFFRETLMASCEIWLVISEDSPKGLLAVDGDQIEQLYIDPTAQRQGFGSALLAHAKQRSDGRMVLHTHQRNERARRFYEAREFRVVSFGISGPPESEPDVFYEWNQAAV